MADALSIHMNDGRRIEFAGTLALSHFVASRAMHLESLLLAFADDGFTMFQEMNAGARLNLLWLVQGMASELRELAFAMTDVGGAQ
ncbi:hypothetical protein [Burkholderia pseudomallei]|uniref:hypothetical protein n=1 Tax=Burkholderia pseudomallei TaxID=28450 RepID=UPI000A1A10C7|nr:hypothetical protein [Burkholderia pseudomallei]ARK94260.1 hypothetical protein BOC43_07295 [Burkholderia pseudomallei]MBF3573439.1 hypothetical protein [Burkholderia pseudomallei]MBF3660038.1 hypothetical protein [Burkholderia pseudomallei]MBF3696027.1 hypothetical protein [Burkholderia pseudomallei]MBF3701978.1 hypothetical protein [Burkholderia pseudomallei]